MWAVHDCLYRARSAGAEWALFLDLDELLVLNGAARSLPELTAGLEARGVACASLGSVPYNTLECGASAASPLPDRFVWRAQEPEVSASGGLARGAP